MVTFVETEFFNQVNNYLVTFLETDFFDQVKDDDVINLLQSRVNASMFICYSTSVVLGVIMELRSIISNEFLLD
jgi:hypothetical protein